MTLKSLCLVRKKSIVIAGTGILVMLILPFLTLLSPRDFRDSVHRIYVANVIADNLTEGVENKSCIVEIFFDFVYNNIFPDMGESPVDMGALNTLVRGIGWCDQQAFVLNELCSYQNIAGCRLDLQTRHSVSLILLKTRFNVERPLAGGVYDPLNGVIFKDQSGNVAGYKNLYKRETKFKSLAAESFKRKMGREYLDYFQHELPAKLTYPRPMQVDSWRNVIRKLVKYYYLLGGKFYFNLYQDAYLSLARKQAWEMFDLNLPDTRLYYRARCYQLVGRFEKAVKIYTLLITDFPESKYTERSCIFMASSLMKQKKWNDAREALEEFNNNFSSSQWNVVGQSYLDWIYYNDTGGDLPEERNDAEQNALYFN